MTERQPRSALITGTSSGIGRCTALALDKHGWRVFAGVRRPEDGAALRAEARGLLQPLLLDVTDPTSLANARATLEAALGQRGLDGLVNNAGVTAPGPLEFLSLAELRALLEVNVIGTLAVIQEMLELLRLARGRIVNIGSIGGFVASPFQGAYCASKFALEGLTDSLRLELTASEIEVSLIQPGSVDTAIWDKGRRHALQVVENFSERAKALYGDAAHHVLGALNDTASRAASPDAVVRQILHALEAKRPRTRYLAGRDAKLARWITWLPDRTLDRVLRTAFRLPSH